jgi:competence protein ComGC
MPEDGNKPGVAFWATVAVGVPAVLFIAFVAVPNLRRGRGGGQDVNKVLIKAVEDALEMYALDHNGHFPSTTQGLDVLWLRSDADEAWKGPYVKSKGPLLDVWGTRLLYDEPPAGSESISPKVWSAGPDKVPNTSDDIH